MYIVLTGAKKNVGDFLIRDRSLKLLSQLKPNNEFIEMNSWERLDDKLEIINQSKGLIICGGPGYKQDMYPNVYPLVKDIDDIKVPIYILGAGWYGITGDEEVINNYKFTKSSLKLLKKVEQTGGLSCRDYFTKRVLSNNGIDAKMTGCPVMYNLKYLNHSLRLPEKIESIVFTTPQDPIYTKQCMKLMTALKEKFSKQNIFASFHRGLGRDKGTGYLEGVSLEKMANHAVKLGFEVVDASYDLSKIEFYSNTDLHVGYRVHAHLYYLSERKPSFLINEDGRGTGFCDLLGLSGVEAYKRTSFAKYSTVVQNRVIKKIINKTVGYSRAFSDISNRVINYMTEEIENRFVRFEGIDRLIDRYYDAMKDFVLSIK